MRSALYSPILMATSSSSLRGSLLLAAPLLRDPNFARSVLYLAAHTDKDGAFGYILNRPLDKTVSDLIPVQEMRNLARVPVYLGGPVSTDKLSFASLEWSNHRNTLKCKTHLAVEDAQHELSLGHDVRAFVGYSGWSEGQLEKELQHRSWIVTPPQSVIVTAEDPTSLWSDILIDLGPKYELIARMPDQPDLN
jgi:putative transcriptional regulator